MPSSPPPDEQARYRGPEYEAALERPFDPLVHAYPFRPTRGTRFLLGLITLLVRVTFRFRVEGLENLPRPPYLVAANHQRWYDAAFIIAALPRPPLLYVMARRDTVFNRGWKRWLMRRLLIFPISPDRGELDQRGLDTVYQLLGRRACVLIFPEGRYSRGPKLQPLKKGIAHFALQAGVPVLPVAVSNLDRVGFRGTVTVTAGAPILPEPPRWWTLNQRAAQLLGRLRESLLQAFDSSQDRRRGDKHLLGRLRDRVSQQPPAE